MNDYVLESMKYMKGILRVLEYNWIALEITRDLSIEIRPRANQCSSFSYIPCYTDCTQRRFQAQI